MRIFKGISAMCLALAGLCVNAHEATQVAAASKQSSPLPARKAGLWEVTVRSDDLVLRRQGQAPQRPFTVRQCTSQQAEPVMLLSILPGQENCSKTQAGRRTRDAGGWRQEITTVCRVHENRVDARVELRGDLQSAYTGSFDVKYAQTPMNNTGRMVFEGRWLGACSAGQKPGDMVLPNGVTVNVVEDRRRAEGNGHSGHKH